MSWVSSILSGLGSTLGFPETGNAIGNLLDTGYTGIDDLLGDQSGGSGLSNLGGLFNAGNGIWGALSSGLGILGNQVSNRKALEQSSKQWDDQYEQQERFHKDAQALAWSELKLQKKQNILNAYNAAMQARGQAAGNIRQAGEGLTSALQNPALMRSRYGG